MIRLLPALLLLSLLCPPLRADASAAELPLQEGRVEAASALLHAWLADHPSDARAHLLLCRALYAQEMADPAVSECEAAAAAAPGSSETQLWLGRAYGMKASSANPLVAFSVARKVRDAFERSVQIDGANLAAASDLGEFYVAAPSIVGGGAGKARSLAARLHALGKPDAEALSHRILAMLAEKASDLPTAEGEFRLATAADGAPAWIDLAAFYARHGQPAKAAAAIHTALRVDKTRGPSLVDAAGVLIDAEEEPALARKLLEDYLASPAKSDAAPAFRVRLQLGKLLAKAGEEASAQKQYALALALAPNYRPARKAAQATTPASMQSAPGSLQTRGTL